MAGRLPARWLIAVISSLAAVCAVFVGNAPASAVTAETILGTSAPRTASDPDDGAVTLGIKFKTKKSGSITAIRYFKGASNVGTHVGAIYSASGRRIAEATDTNETSYGWQAAPLSNPVEVDEGETYTAAVFMPVGHYAVTDPYDWPVERASLTGLVGTYSYGGSLRYPSQTYQESNYFIDVAFVADAPAPPDPVATPAPSATAAPPAGAFPDASTTGVQAGVTLSPYTGPSVITEEGTVIDKKLVKSCLVIKADNVTIRNSLFRSDGCFFNVLSDDGNTGMTLTDVEIDGLNNTTGDSAINGGGFTCLRCDIHGTVDGVKAQSNVVIKDSYIHDLAQGNDSHNDGIQSLGTTSLRILHNSIVIDDGSTSAIILSTGSSWAMRNVQIDGNLLGGGAYTVYGGYLAGTDVLSRVSLIAITNNRFTTKIHPRSGAFGPLTSIDPPVVVLGNTWYDGPNAGKPVF